MHGDLQERFEDEVINNPNPEERDGMMAAMNILCGHVEMECTYVMYYQKHEECNEICDGQLWYDGHADWFRACDILEDGQDHWDHDHEEGPDLWTTIFEEHHTKVCCQVGSYCIYEYGV